MDVYTSENEQVEALHRWWKKNGTATLIAVFVTIAAVLGYRTWQDNRTARAGEASALFQEVLEANDPAAVLEKGRALLANYNNTPYASLASLAMGSAAMQQNDADAAAAHLRAAMEGAKIPGIKQVAAVRLARVLLSQGKPQEALAIIDGVKAAGLDGAFAEVRGDAELALGRNTEARQAYEKALAAYGDLPAKQRLLQIKIDDLAGGA